MQKLDNHARFQQSSYRKLPENRVRVMPQELWAVCERYLKWSGCGCDRKVVEEEGRNWLDVVKPERATGGNFAVKSVYLPPIGDFTNGWRKRTKNPNNPPQPSTEKIGRFRETPSNVLCNN